MSIRVEGLEKVIKNLNREVKKIGFRTKKGMIKAGLFIQREAQIKTPIDLGNLRASAFTTWNGGPIKAAENPSFKGEDGSRLSNEFTQVINEDTAKLSKDDTEPEVEVGFSAFYALFVHENLENAHTVGEAKFLQNAIQENTSRILKIITDEAKE